MFFWRLSYIPDRGRFSELNRAKKVTKFGAQKYKKKLSSRALRNFQAGKTKSVAEIEALFKVHRLVGPTAFFVEANGITFVAD
jgi:hypothetical protein